MQIKVSYCKMYQPDRKCLQNEPAVILRGRGPFQFEIFQDFKCRCNRPLYAHQSWQEGPYDYFIYSCGKVSILLHHDAKIEKKVLIKFILIQDKSNDKDHDTETEILE